MALSKGVLAVSRTKRIAKLPQELMIGDVPTVDDGAIEPTALALL
jgi:hypothetical protein